MKLRIGGGEIDQIIRVRKHRSQLPALPVIKKNANFFSGQWPSEPLHVVFHENLHRGAIDRTSTLDRQVCAAGNGHMSAEENFFCHFERSEAKSRNLLLFSALQCEYLGKVRDVLTALEHDKSGANRGIRECHGKENISVVCD